VMPELPPVPEVLKAAKGRRISGRKRLTVSDEK